MQVLSDKEKRRNASMLSYERTGLAATSLARSGEVSESPIEDLSTSSRGVGDSGFLSRYAVDATAVTIAETNLQLEKEKMKGFGYNYRSTKQRSAGNKRLSFNKRFSVDGPTLKERTNGTVWRICKSKYFIS